jgi:Holliday junction resolvase
MSLSRRNPRRDGNESALVMALEAQGFVVMRVSGAGCPDLVVWHRASGRAWPVEIKQPKGTHTEAQVRWKAAWRGPAPITLRTIDDALRFALVAMETMR